MIPLATPNLSFLDKKNLIKAFDSSWISTSGKEIAIFEKELSNYVGSKYAVACNSGTSALHIAIKVAGILPDDEVMVPSLTFASTVNTIIYNGARPIFFNCDKFLNININDVKNFLENFTYFKNGSSYNKKTGKKISAIVPVHMYGNASNIFEIDNLLKERKIKIIEDAAESLGSRYLYSKYKNKFTGNIGSIGIFSFNANKIITSGSGGMIVTNNRSYAERANLLVNQAKINQFEYKHSEVGYNYKMNNLCASVGLSQFYRLNKFIKKKQTISKLYKKIFNFNENIKFIDSPDYSFNNNWMPLVKLSTKNKGERNKIINALFKNDIQVRGCWDPLHNQKPYRNFQNYNVKSLNKLTNSLICLPSSTHINIKEVEYVAKTLIKIL